MNLINMCLTASFVPSLFKAAHTTDKEDGDVDPALWESIKMTSLTGFGTFESGDGPKRPKRGFLGPPGLETNFPVELTRNTRQRQSFDVSDSRLMKRREISEVEISDNSSSYPIVSSASQSTSGPLRLPSDGEEIKIVVRREPNTGKTDASVTDSMGSGAKLCAVVVSPPSLGSSIPSDCSGLIDGVLSVNL